MSEKTKEAFDKASRTYQFALDSYQSDHALWEEQKNFDAAWAELKQARTVKLKAY